MKQKRTMVAMDAETKSLLRTVAEVNGYGSRGMSFAIRRLAKEYAPIEIGLRLKIKELERTVEIMNMAGEVVDG